MQPRTCAHTMFSNNVRKHMRSASTRARAHIWRSTVWLSAKSFSKYCVCARARAILSHARVSTNNNNRRNCAQNTACAHVHGRLHCARVFPKLLENTRTKTFRILRVRTCARISVARARLRKHQHQEGHFAQNTACAHVHEYENDDYLGASWKPNGRQQVYIKRFRVLGIPQGNILSRLGPI